MLIYYGWILMSVVMFGGGFAIQDQYRKHRGESLRVSMESACIGALAGLFILLAIHAAPLTATPFTLLMATLAALNSMAFTFCSFKALGRINLSLFSLFAMLGGMALPFLQGIVFYREGVTLSKIICVLFICASLLCTVTKGKQKGTLFYVGIFVLNGMSGVISKLFTSTNLPKTGATEYSIWIAVVTTLLSSIAWGALTAFEKRKSDTAVRVPPGAKGGALSCSLAAANGAVNRVANLLLVYALAFVDTSVQYPMVTGGTIIVSTCLSYFGKKKPTRRDLLGVALAFAGMCALFLIPV